MSGFLVTVNGEELVAVSTEGLNILTVNLHGDVLGPEVGAIEVYGGMYGEGEADKHLIWVSDHEVRSDDEVEIAFCASVATSRPGKTIEELHPAAQEQPGPSQPLEKLFEDLAAQERLREQFIFELVPPSGEVIHAATSLGDYQFFLGAMWKWLKPNEARVSLTSNSIAGVQHRTNGTTHARLTLHPEEAVKLRTRG